MLAQRCRVLCGQVFQIERKRGRPRLYCGVCSPPGFQVVVVRSRYKLRRRPPAFRRIDVATWLANPSMWDESA